MVHRETRLPRKRIRRVAVVRGVPWPMQTGSLDMVCREAECSHYEIKLHYMKAWRVTFLICEMGIITASSVIKLL